MSKRQAVNQNVSGFEGPFCCEFESHWPINHSAVSIYNYLMKFCKKVNGKRYYHSSLKNLAAQFRRGGKTAETIRATISENVGLLVAGGWLIDRGPHRTKNGKWVRKYELVEHKRWAEEHKGFCQRRVKSSDDDEDLPAVEQESGNAQPKTPDPNLGQRYKDRSETPAVVPSYQQVVQALFQKWDTFPVTESLRKAISDSVAQNGYEHTVSGCLACISDLEQGPTGVNKAFLAKDLSPNVAIYAENDRKHAQERAAEAERVEAHRIKMQEAAEAERRAQEAKQSEMEWDPLAAIS